MLSNPWTGGGMEHVFDCFKQYAASARFNAEQLVDYAGRLGNAAVLKRLGFLAERLLGDQHFLVAACKSRLSKGNATEPAIKGDNLITRWRLFVPSALALRTKNRVILKNELVDLATQANLQTHVIEKDYVLGWLLAGINRRPELSESWVFKGGTCLRNATLRPTVSPRTWISRLEIKGTSTRIFFATHSPESQRGFTKRAALKSRRIC